MKTPFPYFGGKSRVANEVWARFGDIRHLVDPFCGSCALWLLRPEGLNCIATFNDLDGLLVNFWRASAHDPEGLAKLCDWPVSELDLHARRKWLMKNDECIAEKLRADPEFYDLKAAAWWVWGISQWIGDKWAYGALESRRIPSIGCHGRGVMRESITDHLGYFEALKDRMRGARFCSGDWQRVLTGTVLFSRTRTPLVTPVGVFLDPPYGTKDRSGVYKNDSAGVAKMAAEWAMDMASKHDMLRIAICDYDETHEMEGWAKFRWRTSGGFSKKGGRGENNSFKETVWFSPSCLDARQGDLFCSRGETRRVEGA